MTVIFKTLTGGYYGIGIGEIEYGHGFFVEVKNHRVIHHPTNTKSCSHRVGDKDILKTVSDEYLNKTDKEILEAFPEVLI